MKTLIVVIYDSIYNSVFESQVIAPLKKRVSENPSLAVTLVSFEKSSIPEETIAQKIPAQFQPIILKRYPFVNRISLWPAILQLYTLLGNYSSYEIIARGPFAGYIAQKALRGTNHCTIQARGLVAQEFAYTKPSCTGLKKTFHQYRFEQLQQLEYRVYSNATPSCIIEVVSPALKDYICATYKTPDQHVTIALYDAPPCFEHNTIIQWRCAQRTTLGIDQNAPVYCYAGSLKPWQCPEQTIMAFKKILEENHKSILLILSQDKEAFKKLVQDHQIPEESYKIISVSPEKIYHYLATADYGFILREEHIINWTSRPTKLLEYQAVGLKIIHNNTIAFLCTHQSNQQANDHR